MRQIPPGTKVVALKLPGQKMAVKVSKPNGEIAYGLYSEEGRYQNELLTFEEVKAKVLR